MIDLLIYFISIDNNRTFLMDLFNIFMNMNLFKNILNKSSKKIDFNELPLEINKEIISFLDCKSKYNLYYSNKFFNGYRLLDNQIILVDNYYSYDNYDSNPIFPYDDIDINSLRFIKLINFEKYIDLKSLYIKFCSIQNLYISNNLKLDFIKINFSVLNDIEYFDNIDTLTNLDLSYCHIVNSNIQLNNNFYRMLFDQKKLVKLNLLETKFFKKEEFCKRTSFYSFHYNDFLCDLSFLNNKVELRELSLTGLYIKDSYKLIEITKLIKLESLSLTKSRISTIDLSCLTNLTYLNLSDTKLFTDNSIIGIDKLINLKTLYLHQYTIDDLFFFNNLIKLKSLSIIASNIINIDLSNLTNLTDLNCSLSILKYRESIIGLYTLSNLVNLDLSRTNFIDININNFNKLKNINLQHCKYFKLDQFRENNTNNNCSIFF